MEDYIREMYLAMVEEASLYEDYVSDRFQLLTKGLMEQKDRMRAEDKQLILTLFLDMVNENRPILSVWVYTFLLHLDDQSNNSMLRFIDYTRNNKHLTLNNKYYIYGQLEHLVFINSQLRSIEIKKAMAELWYQMVDEFEHAIQIPLKSIPKEQRNQNLIVLITPQILGQLHAPSKIAYERCRSCMKTLGKKVVLVNTAEVLTERGKIPFYDNKFGNYMEELTQKEYIIYRDVKIPFIQCENIMPSLSMMDMIIKYIYQLKPYMVIGIGKTILFDLFSKLTTTVLSPLGADIEPTYAQYQFHCNELREEEKVLCQYYHVDFSSLLPVKPEYSLIQTSKLTKKEIGIPEDKFILTVFGARLDDEVSDEFCDMLNQTMNEHMFMTFVGVFSHYDQMVSKYPVLKQQSCYVPFTDNMLGFLDNCDLYVNPIRSGGGTSGVAALFKGVPVVTTGTGDIAIAIGNDFVTNDYNTMSALIQRYEMDNELYSKQSEKAKLVAGRMVNTDHEFVTLIKEIGVKEYDRF